MTDSFRSMRILPLVLLAACGGETPAVRAPLLAGRPLAGPVRLAAFGADKVKQLPFEVDPKSLIADQVAPEEFLLVELDDGYLVGTNVGEWRGGIWWFSRDGSKREHLIEDNCVAIATDGRLFVCLTGLAHLTLTEGYVTILERTAGHWRSCTSVPLPGEPYDVELEADNSLLMVCSVGVPNVFVDEPEGSVSFKISVRYRAGTVTYGRTAPK